MAATNAQVQQYVNERVRPRCEQIRKVWTLVDDDRATLDDVYANLTDNPTWTDTRADAPPHLAVPNDVLAWNTFLVGMQKLKAGTFASQAEANSFAAQWAIVQKLCVRAPEIV